MGGKGSVPARSSDFAIIRAAEPFARFARGSHVFGLAEQFRDDQLAPSTDRNNLH
jgi:hypothetical protein